MIKRPLNPQFTDAVLTGRKFTTIRDKPWPVGVPIMLYHWSAAPYRSPQINVAPIIVQDFWTIRITRSEAGVMYYIHGMENATPLHATEGFESPDALDDWFRPLVKPGETLTKTLMRFLLVAPATAAISVTTSKT